MIKFGVIGVGYSCEDGLRERLDPWFSDFGKEFVFKIKLASSLFKGFTKKNNENTVNIIKQHYGKSLVQINDGKMEHDVRNALLNNLLDCDYVWLLDFGDEYYTFENILSIARYVKTNRLYDWFSINFKNYVFDGKSWIDGFCPPRIFKTKMKNGSISKCYWDNDFSYIVDSIEIPYKQLACKQIPKNVAHVRHDTWLNKNGKEKVKYQMEHFGLCSYRWNDSLSVLEFDELFYKKNGQKVPELHKD